jgi:hypothetical protein
LSRCDPKQDTRYRDAEQLTKQSLKTIDSATLLQHMKGLDSLENLVSFLAPLILINQTPEFSKLGSKALISAHNANIGLFVDKYLLSAIPDVQTELLLESTGLGPEKYEAALHEDPGKRYFMRWCSDKRFIWDGFTDAYLKEEYEQDDYLSYLNREKQPAFFDGELINGHFDTAVSEFVEPVVQGGSWNPYLRYRSSRNSGSAQCSKWQDFAGSGWNNAKINALVFTYPEELSNVFLLAPDYRVVMEKRCKCCFKSFLKDFKNELGVSPGMDIAVSESFHPWSTSNPVKPHLHHHVLQTHFMVRKVSEQDRKNIESKFAHEFSILKGCLNESGDIVDSVTYGKVYGFLDNALQKEFGLTFLEWKGVSVDPVSGKTFKTPLDGDRVKELWSDAVKSEFVDLLSTDHWYSTFDVQFYFISVSNKQKLLHALSYKCRPPVVDLDLFFRRNKNVVLNYDKVDIMAVNDPDTRFYLEDKGAGDFLLSWLQYLVRHHTKTSVFGFWRVLKRYQVSPVDVKIRLPRICPICGGVLSVGGVYFGYPVISCLFVKFGSNFKIVSIWDPGG